MPRYYFHLDARSNRAEDGKGIECDDLEEAIEYAQEIASELRQLNPPERIFGKYIVVCDEAGNEVKRLPLIPPSSMLLHARARRCPSRNPPSRRYCAID
jgi:hypothetical protein